MSDDQVPELPSKKSAQLFNFPSAVRRRSNLPAMSTRVIGRGEVIDSLQEQVQKARLVTIVGAGGIGKTTVALSVAEQAIDAFPDGVWLVDFAPLRDPSLVPHTIASATGLAVHSANVLAAVCRFVRDRRMLLVFDNCEHLIPSIASCLVEILQAGADVHVLTTSRTVLHVDDEQVHRLLGLSVPSRTTELSAKNALGFSAIELFVDRATDRMETFVLDDENARTVADICTSLDGIALAIELAAMRVDVFGVKGLLKQLEDRFRLLTGRRAGLERHRTLIATFDWSYSLLPENEAAVLRATSVFTGAFRLAGAAGVANVSLGEATVVLAELGSKSLLSVELDAVDSIYRLLETTRAYCLDRLAGTGEEQLIRHRHAEYVCAVLEQATTDWAQQVSRDWGATYGPHLEDLRAALAWAGLDPAHCALQIRLTVAGTLLWNHFSLTDESRAHLSRAILELGKAGLEDTAVEMNLQSALAGALLYTRGIVPEARVAMGRALQISERLGDTDFQLRCLRLIGTYELFSGEAEKGIHTLGTFFSIATAGDPSALAEGETHLSVGEMFVGRPLIARKRMELLHAKQSQDFHNARFARFQYSNSVNVLVVLSHAQWLTGFPVAAAQTAEKILEYGLQATHELSLSIGLAWNCLLYFWLGRDGDCSRQTAMLDELVERHGIETWRPIATFCRGALACRGRSGSSKGVEELRRAVSEFRMIGHMARLPFYVAVLAESLAKRALFEEAEAAIIEAMELASVQKERWCMPEILRIKAGIATAQGDNQNAELLLQESINVAKDTGALAWQLRSSSDLAVLWQSQSRTVDAKGMLQAVYDEFSEGFEIGEVASASILLAGLK